MKRTEVVVAIASLALLAGTALGAPKKKKKKKAKEPEPAAEPAAEPEPAAPTPEPAAPEGGGATEGGGGSELGGGGEETATTPPPGEPFVPPPPLTLYKGKLVIAGATLNFNVSSGAIAKPISLAPSVWYGIDDKITIGLTHDGGTTPVSPRPALKVVTVDAGMGATATAVGAGGICVTGTSNGCPLGVYDNIGADLLYRVKNHRLSVAVHGGLDIVSFGDDSPLAQYGPLLQLRAGALGRYMVNNKFGVVFDPRVRVGLSSRDFNKDAIDLPVWAWYEINPKVSAFFHVGLDAPFDGFGDALRLPLGFGGNYMVNDKLTAGVDFYFLDLAGNVVAGGGAADLRMLLIRAVYRI